MSARPDEHWLWRLSAQDWLAAATTELDQGRARVDSRRTAVTHARRAAGMALNAVLVSMIAHGWSRERCESSWGRSYIDHIRTLAQADRKAIPELPEALDSELGQVCRALLEISVMPPRELVTLARSKDEAACAALDQAAVLVAACATLVSRPATR